MIRNLTMVCSFLLCLSACSPTREVEPTGLIAGPGTTPTIDGVFDSGEWDDAQIVRADTTEQFRVKHDGSNLYFAVRAGGGDLFTPLSYLFRGAPVSGPHTGSGCGAKGHPSKRQRSQCAESAQRLPLSYPLSAPEGYASGRR